ncbi:MAG: hypothetical protein L3J59_14120 [Methylococcaceae bacterium]|nr:hypothetical protein [Methylococcaceae bacterium]
MSNTPDTPLQRLEKQIRTYTWFQYVLDETNAKDKNELTDKLVVEMDLSKKGQLGWLKKFDNYSCHSKEWRNASGGTIDRMDQIVSGSKDIYLNAPYSSDLFNAMFKGEFGLCLKGQHDHLEGDLKYVLERQNTKPYSNFDFADLSKITILFRYYLKRNQYVNSKMEVEDITTILINLIETKNIKKQLEHFGIRDLYIQWLYMILDNWIINSNAYMVGYLPTEEQFIKNPKLFVRLMIAGIANEPESCKYLSDLQVSKLIEKKTALWLPNEDFIKDQLKTIIKPFSSFSSRAFKIWFHAFVETSRPMKWFNQSIRLISVFLILFFFISLLLLIKKMMPMAVGTSLFCLMVSLALYKNVQMRLKFHCY